ncbi:hypothetical protein BDD12DRAFT_919552 [Trichophaea hybrida]|nr:hypothetical protein BDD12DRAFT_919552 [Trichophaea hybrida]
MSLNCNSDISIRDQWARQHATRGIKELWNKRLDRSPPGSIPRIGFPGYLKDGDSLPKLPRSDGKSTYQITDAKVAIVGAGAAGLFTGMILDYLNKDETLINAGFHVSYDIFETASKDRVGGRLFTYNFKAQDSRNPQGPHDYYDVGAMRFPENPVMKRLFDLFTSLGMEKKKLADDPPVGSLVPYYIQNIKNENENEAVREPWCYNNITRWGDYQKITAQDQYFDPFRLNTDKKIPQRHTNFIILVSIITRSPDDVVNDTIQPLRDALRNDLDESPPGTAGWKLLMKYDKYSTRQFLSLSPEDSNDDDSSDDDSSPPYNYETIEFLETFNGGTNWYDQAHSETVLESLDFEYYDQADENKWWCVLGGAQQLALRMENSLNNKPAYLSRVTAIRVLDKLVMEIDIERPACGWESGKEKKKYNGVFNATTLGCLKRIDTRTTNLSYSIQQAIRSLGYGPSAKVGIKFKRAWWIHDLDENHRIEKGGLGHSDLTIRTCVYPSYNINDSKDKPAVLLCSYTWQQDAERIGAMMSSSSDHSQQLKHEADLKEVLLRDLARLHTYHGTTEDQIYKLISDNYLDHYAHDWTHDPNTAGAFAFYRPQQFSNVWNKMIHPTGNLIVIGEAASPHHAWVVGALESAVHGVHHWLNMRKNDIKGAKEALKLLETPEDVNPFVGLPPYMEQATADWIIMGKKGSEK